MRIKHLVLLFFLLIASSCGKENDIVPFDGEAYLENVLDIMQSNSLFRDEVDWEDLRAQVYAEINGTETLLAIYPGIDKALSIIGDNHSFFVRHDGRQILGERTISCEFPPVDQPTLPENIGYIRVRGYSGPSDDANAISYAEGIRNQIASQDSENLVGWILDLRSMGGGNMWPMIAGLGPVLGEGIAGYFVDAVGKETSWGFKDNASVADDFAVTRLAVSHELQSPNAKVAVLTNNGVASSGEVVAISFIGKANTMSFGENTCGLSTANTFYDLGSNTELLLTTAYLADRNKTIYGMQVEPDVLADDTNVIGEAVDWIQSE